MSGNTVDAQVDDQGNFVLHPRRPSGLLRGVKVNVQDAEGHGSKDVVFDASMITTHDWGYDLGNLHLSALRNVDVLVVDTTGRPVPRAVVFPVDQLGDVSEPTNAEGRTILQGATESLTIIAAVAAGFRVGQAPILAAGATRIELVRTNAIEIRLVLPHGQTLDGHRVRLVSSVPLFGDGTWRPTDSYRHVQVSPMVNQSTGQVEFSPVQTDAGDAAIRFLIVDLSPGEQFQLKVLDGKRQVLSTHPQAGLGADERRSVTIDVGLAER